MHTIGGFYRQTWWLWLLFFVLFTLLTYYVSIIFVLMIPGIIAYSIYFGVIRTSELNDRERESHHGTTA